MPDEIPGLHIEEGETTSKLHEKELLSVVYRDRRCVRNQFCMETKAEFYKDGITQYIKYQWKNDSKRISCAVSLLTSF
mgnify:CR=1 FL=1